MIKYKYLPFTRNKPRYQRVHDTANSAPASTAKWQLAAQTLTPGIERIENITTASTSISLPAAIAATTSSTVYPAATTLASGLSQSTIMAGVHPATSGGAVGITSAGSNNNQSVRTVSANSTDDDISLII